MDTTTTAGSHSPTASETEPGVHPGEHAAGAESRRVEPPAHSSQKSPWDARAFWILVVLGIAAYANSFQGAWLFDDHALILESPGVTRLLPPKWLTDSIRPLGTLSFALNYAAGAYSTWGYHAVNLAIHVAAAYAAFAWLRRTIRFSPAFVSIAQWADVLALAVAAMWLVHPLQTQAVTYIHQRYESLASLWMLLSMHALARAITEPDSKGRTASWIFGLLAILTKEIAVVLPILAFSYERLLFQPSASTSHTEVAAPQRSWRYHLAMFALWGVLAVQLGRFQAEYASGGIGRADAPSPWAYFLTQHVAVPRYLKLLFWPVDQVFWMRIEPQAPSLTLFAIAAPIWIALAATIVGLLRGRAGSFAGLWFFSILGVTSSFVPIRDNYFEHRMYLPSLAPMAVIVVGTAALCARWRRASFPRPLLGATALIVVALAATTMQRNRMYADPVAVWTEATVHSPGSAIAWSNLAGVQLHAQRYKDSLASTDRAIELDATGAYSGPHLNRAIALLHLGRDAEARSLFDQYAPLVPLSSVIEFHQGNARRRTEPAIAIAHYRRAIELNPSHSYAYLNLGTLLVEYKNAISEAEYCLRKAVAIDPRNAEAFNNLGLLAYQRKDIPTAIAFVERALQVNPNFVMAQRNLKLLQQALEEQQPKVPGMMK